MTHPKYSLISVDLGISDLSLSIVVKFKPKIIMAFHKILQLEGEKYALINSEISHLILTLAKMIN